MIVKPLDERRRNRPVAFVIDASQRGVLLVTADEERFVDLDELRLFDGYVYLFCQPMRLLSHTDARQWTGYSWNGGLNKLVLDGGPTCYPFALNVRAMPTWEAIDEGFALFRWLLRYGVIPGSVSSMSWRLWRARLDRPVQLARRRLLGERAFYGGRQEAPYPGDYRDCRYFDLTAAYPMSMANDPYPTRIESAGTQLGDGCGFARATVNIPKMEWCPLPVRLHRNALCYGWGEANGFWPWSDLRLARDLGCDVNVHESWQGVENVDLFGEWWEDIVLDGRRNVPLSKSVTSRLWGGFSLSQSTGYMIRWEDAAGKRKVRTALQSRSASIPTAPYIAAETTARVRDRLYREAIGGCDDVIYCDTDAVITGGSLSPENVGLMPGQWRVKREMVRCEIRGPQCFRSSCANCNQEHALWHYTVAGASTADLAARIFDRTKRHAGTAYTPGQLTFPSDNLERYRHARARNLVH